MLKVFSVYDAKIALYAQPFFSLNEQAAERMFREVAMNKEANLAKFPEDYALFVLGTYNEETGLFVSLPAPEMLIHAMHVQTQETIPEGEQG